MTHCVDIRVHKDYLNTLLRFGPLNEVLDRMYEAAYAGLIEVTGLPPAPPKDNMCCKRLVSISHPYYHYLVQTHGATSTLISVRRLLYYFVDNELYTVLMWQPVDRPASQLEQEDRADRAYSEGLARSLRQLRDTLRVTPSNCRDAVSAMVTTVTQLIQQQEERRHGT